MERRVSALYTYPVKSCGGISLEHSHVGWTGLLYDREWMLVDEGGKPLTQREYPRLCRITTAFGETHLRVRAPNSSEYWTPLYDERRGETCEVEVWGDRVPAIDEGKTASRWFSHALGVDCRLVRVVQDTKRLVRGQTFAHIGFADGQQFLIVSEASLADLNGRLEAPVPMDRFRPNIVMSGCGPYEEDAWTEIRIGGVHLLGAGRCPRCSVITVDQETGARGKEPLATLAAYRKAGKSVVFGKGFNSMNGGVLCVGDPVELIG